MENKIELLTAADLALKEQRYQDALNIYQQLPLDKFILNNMALIYVKLGEIGKAHDLLLDGIEKYPQEAIIYNQLANIYSHYHEYQKARISLEKAIELDPKQASFYNNLGSLLLKQDLFTEAKECFLAALKQESDYYAAMFNLAICYKKLNQEQDAIACLLALIEYKPNYVQPYFLLAKILLENHRITEALQYYEKLVALFPDDLQVLHNIAVSLLEKNYFHEAKGYCESILAHDPKHYLTAYNLGVIAEKLSDPLQAIHWYEKVLSIQPNFLEALNNLGVIYLSLNQYDKAKFYFSQAAKLAPDNESIQHTLNALSGSTTKTQAPAEYVANLFDQYADHYDQHLLTSLDYQVPELLWQTFQKFSTKATYQILDLGCGTGLVGEKFKPIAEQLIGVDLSQNMLSQASNKLIYDDLIQEEVITFLKNCIQSFDIILLADVLVYFGDLEELFKMMLQRLNISGWIGFSIEIGEQDNYFLQPSGRFSHSIAYIEKLAQQFNLSIVYKNLETTRMQFDKPIIGAIIWLQTKSS